LGVEAGRIVEQGRHAQLLQLRGAYYRLYMSQFAGENAEAVFSENTVDDATAVRS
jgi:ATP-binding cassette, subfamily B, multidrug efflux pump